MEEKMRSVNIRLSDSELALLRRAARLQMRPIASFVRAVSITVARRELAEAKVDVEA